MSRWRTAFDITSTCLMLSLGVVIVWQGRGGFLQAPPPPPSNTAPIPGEPVDIQVAERLGSASALVAVLEFADFECPSCAQFARTAQPALVKKYVDTGRVLWAFKEYPLPSHRGARKAARAAWCAGRQQKFWDTADRLFRLRGGLEDEDLAWVAKAGGVDSRLFDSCRIGEESEQNVQRDREDGERLKVPGTPTFFIGRLIAGNRIQVTDTVVGSRPIDYWEGLLDRLMKK